MNIIVLVKKDGDDLKGEFLSAHNRTKYLSGLMSEVNIVPYIIREYDGVLLRLVKRTKKREKINTFVHEGIEYRVIWVKSLLVDTILSRLFNDKLFLYRKLSLFAQILPACDFIIAHSYYSGFIANTIKKNKGTSFSVTWHGSDIHSNPKNSVSIRIKTAEIIEGASVNFFVSNNLLNTSSYITTKGNKKVLYNGVNVEKFYKFSREQVETIREKYHMERKLNVAFVGNLYPVKNVMVLPLVFKNLHNSFGESIGFHIVGDGFLRNKLEEKFKQESLSVRFWGNVSPENMPEIINAMNLVVLPSKNEGLPLIAAESLACGTPLLGSDVGGIKEVVGEDYVVQLNENFIEQFSRRAKEILLSNLSVVLKRCFVWENTSKKEKELMATLF